MDAFYETVTSFCFTLMGLWWAVVQLRREEWVPDPTYRRMAYNVHLSFFVPAIMGLGSMLGGDSGLLWRGVFVAAGLLGIVSTFSIISAVKDTLHGWLFQGGYWAAIALYSLVVLIALNPGIVRLFGTGVSPLQAEGLLVAILVALGVTIAWEFTISPPRASR
ncbi:MAG: hypothetical protein H0T73_13880 [Ardenticatenales bacterium]|nr:hypothetical protein [Ardenticatenales bacterium]